MVFVSTVLRRLFDEIDDHFGQILATVLLQKVPAALDGGMGLTLSPRDLGLKNLFTATGDRIAITKGGQEGFFELGEDFPGVPIGFGSWIIR